VTLLLLALAGAVPDEIVADYELSTACLARRWAARGEVAQSPAIETVLRRKGTTSRALRLDLLAVLDADTYLRAGGLADADLAAVRERLLGDSEAAP
jgi:protein-tyrosine phosphatase